MNTWLHSILLIAAMAPVMAIARLAVASYAMDRVAQGDPLATMLVEPLTALSILVPGLLLGWFTRRHPLLVGAAAGLLVGALVPLRDGPLQWRVGETIGLALFLAVATLAGRALRHRFQPAVAAT